MALVQDNMTNVMVVDNGRKSAMMDTVSAKMKPARGIVRREWRNVRMDPVGGNYQIAQSLLMIKKQKLNGSIQ